MSLISNQYLITIETWNAANEQPGREGGAEEESRQFSDAKTLLDSLTGQKSVYYFTSEAEDFRLKP